MSSSSLVSLPPLSLPTTQTQTLTLLQSTQHHLLTSLTSITSPLSQSQLKSLYAQSLKTNLIQHPQILTQFLTQNPQFSLPILLSLPSPTPFHYNLLLSSLSRSKSSHHQTLILYSRMRSLSIRPDPFTLPPVLRSSSSLSLALESHSISVKLGLLQDIVLRTALIDAFCSLGLSSHARSLFDRAQSPADSIFWNTMIAGHAKCGDFDDARHLFDEMPDKNLSSYNTMIDTCCRAGDIGTARRLFDGMRERDLITWNAMVSGYARAGDWANARELFDSMPVRNVVSWNVVMGCYANSRMFGEALELFREMQGSEEVEPNEVTAVTILPVCAHLGALDLGRWIHEYIKRKRIEMDLFVITTLVDMYGKCGSLEDARRVFDSDIERDVFLYNTMIEVLGMHGKADDAFEVFDLMTQEGIRPNDVTFVGLLKACAHVGLVEIGSSYFEMMSREFGMVPKMEHFGCMVDLLGRAGRLEQVRKLILSMPMRPGPVLWASLLSSCRIHGNVKLAEEVALRLIELEPESCGNYVLLSNTYSKAGQWEDAARVRKVMKEKGVSKKPGCSSIEVSNEIYEFFAGDRDHRQCKEIYQMLDRMVMRLKEEGYEPATSTALHDVGRDGREKSLIHHSEKLALAFGLISTEEGNRIRIVKNLRVCDDCHVFLKLASKCYGREVVVRDCHRFHHFRDGSCSCSDYW